VDTATVTTRGVGVGVNVLVGVGVDVHAGTMVGVPVGFGVGVADVVHEVAAFATTGPKLWAGAADICPGDSTLPPAK